jgi:hypothetical protein
VVDFLEQAEKSKEKNTKNVIPQKERDFLITSPFSVKFFVFVVLFFF